MDFLVAGFASVTLLSSHQEIDAWNLDLDYNISTRQRTTTVRKFHLISIRFSNPLTRSNPCVCYTIFSLNPNHAYLAVTYKGLRELQLISRMSLPGSGKILHGHDLDHQTGPASKVLRPLALARLGVVLFPREARLLPALVHRVDNVSAQTAVQVPGRLLVRAVLGCNVLWFTPESVSATSDEAAQTYVKLDDSQVIDVDPNGTAPVVLLCAVELVLLAQAAQAVGAPQLLLVT